MKRYLAFYGQTYYPLEAMGNFINDFDDLEEAKESIFIKEKEDCNNNFEYGWGLIWDTQIREYVFSKGIII